MARCLEIEVKYEGYVQREQGQSLKLQKLDSFWIPEGFDFSKVSGLSREVQEKLKKSKPSTLGQASRISGITPAAVTLLMSVIEKGGVLKKVQQNDRGTGQISYFCPL